MKKYNIGVIPGDGTGPEVVEESVKVLKAVSKKHNFQMDLEYYDLGGDRYLKTGEVLTDNDIEKIKTRDAVLLGAIGHPDVAPGILEKGILLRLRFELDQYINLRPVILYEGVDTPLKDKGLRILTCCCKGKYGRSYAGGGGFKERYPDEIAIQEQ